MAAALVLIALAPFLSATGLFGACVELRAQGKPRGGEDTDPVSVEFTPREALTKGEGPTIELAVVHLF